jgi:hypothetical protein
MFIVEVMTREGMLCERHASYEEAKQRIEQLPAGLLLGMPLLFQELPDGSQRLIRDDSKPLQWHRLPEDREPGPDEPLPLSEETIDGKVEFIAPAGDESGDEEPPLPVL